MFNLLKKMISDKKDKNETKRGNISLWSYQRFCKFYGYNVFTDPAFEEEIDTIMILVTNGISDINKIANSAGCSVRDCIFKLRYLKNKRWIDSNYYINSHTNEIKKCSENDYNLIDKYYEMIYQKNYSILEMAIEMEKNNQDSSISRDILKEKIFDELKYLSDMSLLSGIKLDEDNKEIKYYSIEKRNNSKWFVSLNCPGCGALIDVPKNYQTKCEYCGKMVDDTYSKKGSEKDA